MKRRTLGPKPVSALGPALALERAYSALFRRLAAIAIGNLADWHGNPHNPIRADASSTWIKDRLARIREAARLALSDGADWIGTIGVVVQRVEKRAGAGLPRVSVRPYVGAHAIRGFRAANVQKIRSLADEQIQELQSLLEVAEAKGTHTRDLEKQIRNAFDVSRSKAALLARDQTLKLAGEITKARQAQAGITEYKWSTSSDERVRPYHRKLNGRIFRWDDPPVISPDGRRGHPGEDYQCRCVAIPVLPDLG